MIGQYLSNTNEKATVSILQNILELNKALKYQQCNQHPRALLITRPCVHYLSCFFRQNPLPPRLNHCQQHSPSQAIGEQITLRATEQKDPSKALRHSLTHAVTHSHSFRSEESGSMFRSFHMFMLILNEKEKVKSTATAKVKEQRRNYSLP